MSGMTSQPSMGALVNHFMDDQKSLCGVDPIHLNELNEYWESVRQLYSPFGSSLPYLLILFVFCLMRNMFLRTYSLIFLLSYI